MIQRKDVIPQSLSGCVSSNIAQMDYYGTKIDLKYIESDNTFSYSILWIDISLDGNPRYHYTPNIRYLFHSRDIEVLVKCLKKLSRNVEKSYKLAYALGLFRPYCTDSILLLQRL